MVCEKIKNFVLINHKFANYPIAVGAESETVSEWRYTIIKEIMRLLKKQIIFLTGKCLNQETPTTSQASWFPSQTCEPPFF